MLPFEFALEGRPVSHQTKNKKSLQRWKKTVNQAAAAHWEGEDPLLDEVAVTITYFYEGESPDVDNIIKPIQDSLIGVVFEDDAQVVDVKSRKRSINGSFRIRGASAVLLTAFSSGNPFIYIVVDRAPDFALLD